jgi:hypothetical protein
LAFLPLGFIGGRGFIVGGEGFWVRIEGWGRERSKFGFFMEKAVGLIGF